jgi:hypothetical protein
VLARARQAIDIRIDRRNDKIELFLLDNAPQHLDPFGMMGGRDDVVSVSVRFLQDELVVVATSDKGRLSPLRRLRIRLLLAADPAYVRSNRSAKQLLLLANYDFI